MGLITGQCTSSICFCRKGRRDDIGLYCSSFPFWRRLFYFLRPFLSDGSRFLNSWLTYVWFFGEIRLQNAVLVPCGMPSFSRFSLMWAGRHMNYASIWEELLISRDFSKDCLVGFDFACFLTVDVGLLIYVMFKLWPKAEDLPAKVAILLSMIVDIACCLNWLWVV